MSKVDEQRQVLLTLCTSTVCVNCLSERQERARKHTFKLDWEKALKQFACVQSVLIQSKANTPGRRSVIKTAYSKKKEILTKREELSFLMVLAFPKAVVGKHNGSHFWTDEKCSCILTLSGKIVWGKIV